MHIQRFIDKVSATESKHYKDFVIPLGEARALRDELMKILVEYRDLQKAMPAPSDPIIRIEMTGGKFK